MSNLISVKAVQAIEGAISPLLADAEARQAAMDFLLVRVSLPSRPLALSTLSAFSRWTHAEGKSLSSLRARDIASFIEAYPAGPSRRRGVLSLLNAFFSHLEREGVSDRNPCGSVLRPKNPYRLGGVTPSLSPEECDRLLLVTGQKGDIFALRDLCLIAALRETLGRIGALLGARVSDLRFHGARRYLRLQEKASKVEMKELSPSLSLMFDDYLRAAPPWSEDSYLFRSGHGRSVKSLSKRPDGPTDEEINAKLKDQEA